MKVQEVILRAAAKKITWWQQRRSSASAIGKCDGSGSAMKSSASVSCLTGDGGNLRRKKVPLAMVERVLELHREKYFDLNLRHFHEKLTGEHQIQLSYSWVKGIVQGAGLRARGRKRGVHRQRRERRPLPGMLLHIDGSQHRWFQMSAGTTCW